MGVGLLGTVRHYSHRAVVATAFQPLICPAAEPATKTPQDLSQRSFQTDPPKVAMLRSRLQTEEKLIPVRHVKIVR